MKSLSFIIHLIFLYLPKSFMSVLPFYNSRPDRLMTFRDPVWECVVLLSDEFEKLNIFLSRGCFCGRLEFKTKYNAAGEISTKSSGRDVLVYWAVIIIRLSWFNPQPTRALAAFKKFYKTNLTLASLWEYIGLFWLLFYHVSQSFPLNNGFVFKWNYMRVRNPPTTSMFVHLNLDITNLNIVNFVI